MYAFCNRSCTLKDRIEVSHRITGSVALLLVVFAIYNQNLCKMHSKHPKTFITFLVKCSNIQYRYY